LPGAPSASSTRSGEPPQLDFRFVRSVLEIGRARWTACFPGFLEDYDYHSAIEKAGIAGMSLGWLVANSGEEIACLVPVFQTEYDLTTTTQGLPRRLLSGVKKFIPGKLAVKLFSLGSPVTEFCPVGFSPDFAAADRARVFEGLLRFAAEFSLRQGCHLFAIKDLTEDDRSHLGRALERACLHALGSLPTAYLPIGFSSIEGYLSGLSAATRKDMRRKLRSRHAIRTERRRDLTGVIDAVMAMYRETRARGELQFEELSERYFVEVLRAMDGRAECIVYFLEDIPIAANLLLLDGTRMIDKFFCMRGDLARPYNLYFLSWFVNLELCLDRGLKIYESGQAGYETKLRLGCALRRNWIYFRHRNRVIDRLLAWVSPMFALDPVPVRAGR
jgi:uncharacterized protein